MKITGKVCPICGGTTFMTVAHVAQTWAVDAFGNFEECISTDEVVADPDMDNSWNCTCCGSDAETVKVSSDEPNLNYDFAIILSGKHAGMVGEIMGKAKSGKYEIVLSDSQPRDCPTMTFEREEFLCVCNSDGMTLNKLLNQPALRTGIIATFQDKL